MPTIAEIIAAKKAKGAPAAPAVPATESLAERVALQEAIDRIDPPGKSQPTPPPRKPAGLVLNKDLPAPPPQPVIPDQAPEQRSLSRTQGEAIPMVPAGASEQTAAWHKAMDSLDTELCVMRDPADTEACWLAIRPRGEELQPLLLHRLPWVLWDHPAQPTAGPF